MSSTERIAIDIFCTHQGVDIAFIQELHDRGLIHLTYHEERSTIDPDELARVEQLVRMHQDLDINLEGLEAISHLLERMEALQREMHTLRQRLRLYEAEE
jgi:hypothetical protein